MFYNDIFQVISAVLLDFLIISTCRKNYLTKKVARFFYMRTMTRLVRNKTRRKAGEN
jgi:hypothetical protein